MASGNPSSQKYEHLIEQRKQQNIQQNHHQHQNNNHNTLRSTQIQSQNKQERKQEKKTNQQYQEFQTKTAEPSSNTTQKQNILVKNIKQSDKHIDQRSQKKQTLKNEIKNSKDQQIIEKQANTKSKLLEQNTSQVQQKSFSNSIEINIKQKNRQNVQKKGEAQTKIEQNRVKAQYNLGTNNKQVKQRDLPVTKRSDESQFVNWQINTIKSGQFGFDKKNTITAVKKQSQMTKNINPNYLSIQLPTAEMERENFQKIDLKVKKHKSKKQVQNTDFNLKLIKQIFCHFCKQNSFSSIKSTLFEEKTKSMEQMSLHKWIVFCKEFDLLNTLYSLKYKRLNIGTNLQNSKINQQRKLKQLKQIEALFTSIFKKATQNRQKMEFLHFLQALQNLFSQFIQYSQQGSLKNFYQFSKIYLYCSTEKQCFNKLSHLKCIFGTPQISYDKVYLDKSIVQKSVQKNKPKLNQLKQPLKPPTIKKVSSYSQKQLTKNLNKFQMNPVIKQAKKKLIIENRTNKNSSTSSMPRNNTNLYQPKQIKIQKLKQQKNELFEYFDSTKDEILDTYFKTQHNSNNCQIKLK